MAFADDQVSAMAVRLAQIMSLNVCDPNESAVTQEVKKRVSLSLFMADRWHSFGLGVPMQLQIADLPDSSAIDEDVFHSTDFETLRLESTPRPGLWAYRIELAKVFGRIQGLLRAMAEEATRADLIAEETEAIVGILEHWKQSLPDDLHLTTENVTMFRMRGRGAELVDLHLGYYHYSTLLFFEYLGRQHPSSKEHHPYAKRCRENALAYASLLAFARAQQGCETVHATVGHMTVISSSVLLYYLLSNDLEEVRASREALISNFESLVELQRYWPGLTRWVSEPSPHLFASAH